MAVGGFSVCRKRNDNCIICTNPHEKLLCQKRSTGTFLRVSFLNRYKRGGGRVRLPSKCCRISHPLLRFGGIKEFRPLRRATKGRRPVDFPLRTQSIIGTEPQTDSPYKSINDLPAGVPRLWKPASL